MNKVGLVLFFILYGILAKAGSVDTIYIYSAAMHKNVTCVVVKPDTYKKKKNHYPVVYLLHGWSGKYSDWIRQEPKLKDYADQYQCLIVCPDGAFGSWYFDSPLDGNFRYETNVGIEIPHFIDSVFRTIPNRNHRAITGLSMGGHGAFWLAFRHAETFSAVGSMSGGVDLMESAKYHFDIDKRIGDTTHWAAYNVLNLVEHYPKDTLQIIFDCGIGDIFTAGNKRLHEKLLALKIKHDYTERPGVHNWDYWRNSLPYHLLFFRSFLTSPPPLSTSGEGCPYNGFAYFLTGPFGSSMFLIFDRF